MPTGYTAAVKDGIPFNKFVWNCARAFGALIMLRDDPSDAEIPARFEPSDTYKKWGDEARAELQRFTDMTPAQAEAAAEAEYQASAESCRSHIVEAQDLLNKYNAMLASVVQWAPPTAEHEALKEFMISQLSESIKFDCGTSYYTEPERQDANVWHREKLAALRKSIARYDEEHAKEVERTEGRNTWLAALRKSVPPPAA